MRLYSIPAGHRLSPELPRETSGMGAVTGRPATGEGEGPRTTAGDQPCRHWHHSAGWLLWCCVELWIPGYIVMPVRICTNLWRLFSILITISPPSPPHTRTHTRTPYMYLTTLTPTPLHPSTTTSHPIPTHPHTHPSPPTTCTHLYPHTPLP